MTQQLYPNIFTDTYYKIVLVGDGFIGKTTYLHWLMTHQFKTEYIPTLGVDVHPITFSLNTNQNVVFNVWDCAGVSKFKGLADGYYKNAEGAIVMLDLNKSDAIASAYVNDLQRINPNILVEMVVPKGDTYSESMKHVASQHNMTVISTQLDENCELPFLNLTQRLQNNNSLTFQN